MKSIRIVIFLMVILPGVAAFAADTYTLPPPAPVPVLPVIPAWEKPLLIGDGLSPGTRMWVQNMNGTLWHYGTTQSVGNGAGMYVYAPAGGPTGFLCAYDIGVRDEFKEFKGISLWIKGDGSNGTAVISTGYFGSANRFRIPLKDTEWHKVFMPWEMWSRPITGPFWFLAFGLERKDEVRPAWYVIDRVRLFKEEKIEEIRPTPDSDPPGLLPAKAFVSGRRQIATTIARLQARKPVKIIIAGDSIAAGTQLWYTQKVGAKAEEAMSLTYFELLGRSLQKQYGYRSLSLPFRSYDGKKKVWTEKPGLRSKSDLTVMAVALSGGSAQNGLDSIDQVLSEKPDLVIWEYGCNDITFGALSPFLASTSKALDRLRAAGIEVIVQSITPGSDMRPRTWMANMSPLQKGKQYNEGLRRIAMEKGCAVADMEGAFLARGAQFTGDLYADFVHPNHVGHEMIADLLDALITDRDIRIWKHGPVVDRVRSAVKNR